MLASRRPEAPRISEIFPALAGVLDMRLAPIDPEAIAAAADCVFMALPEEPSYEYVPALLDRGARVVDLSAAYRLTDPAAHELHYGKHPDPGRLADAAYGLPELFPQPIHEATLVANPGCYVTAAALAAAPALSLGLADPGDVVVDAKSGASGAGRKLAEGFLFCEVNESVHAYKVGAHRHEPEIAQALAGASGAEVRVLFVPHLIPMDRGILATVYLRLAKEIDAEALTTEYRSFYEGRPFVRVRAPGDPPRTKDVCGTNFCDLCVPYAAGGRAVVVAAIDNLVKGASGQAVQNMNLMFGHSETAGLLPPAGETSA
jgi:N-acetyl-gamma-glutamyl-phosphate reductase